MVAVPPPIFYGHQDENPGIFKNWIFKVEQFCIYQMTNKKCGMPKQEFLVELWSIGIIMRTYTYEDIGL